MMLPLIICSISFSPPLLARQFPTRRKPNQATLRQIRTTARQFASVVGVLRIESPTS